MGRIFIEKYEDNRAVFCCSKCNTELFKNANVVLDNVETVKGICMGVVKVMNVIDYETDWYSNIHINHMVNTYDYDAPFNIQNISTKVVMCKYCLSFLGWLHDSDIKIYMINKLSVFLFIR